VVFDVYCKVYGNIENMDVFKVMDLFGVDDQMRCLDLISYARSKVMQRKMEKK